jgi:hypothetical protein
MNFSVGIAKRLKVAAAVLVVGMLPVLLKAFEAGTGINIPGEWEQSWTDWVLAALAGVGVNYTDNVA